MRVFKWGNSLAVRLPAAGVELVALIEGDDIEIDVAGARRLGVRRADFGDRQALVRLRAFRGRLPEGFRFERLEANERGR
jgi:antitoxin MazE